MKHANWIDGSWQPALDGDDFESANDGFWPRSGAEDVAAALDAARNATPAWRAMSFDERAEVLEEALDSWEEDLLLEGEIGSLLRLEKGALDRFRAEGIALGDKLLESAKDPGEGPAEGPILLRVPAAEMSPGLVRAVFGHLLAGRSTLILSDPDLPLLSSAFCALLDHPGLPPGVVSLLHGDRSSALRTALLSGALGGIEFGGTASQLTAVRKILSSGAPIGVPGGGSAAFGTGVAEVEAPDLVLFEPRGATWVVGEADDPEDAAAEVCDGAFDSAAALSGQGSGTIVRVLCHQRLFSSFTEALLEELDVLVTEPTCRLFDSTLQAHVNSLCRLGLDEGATMIRGEMGGAGRKRRSSRNSVPAPVIFTNVEPSMALGNTSRPAPVLSLLRVKSVDDLGIGESPVGDRP